MKVELLGTKEGHKEGDDRNPEVLQLRFKLPTVGSSEVEVTVGYSDIIVDLEELIAALFFVRGQTNSKPSTFTT